MRTWLWLMLVVYLGCGDVVPEEGQFECSDESECPKGWLCNNEGDGRCYSDRRYFPDGGTDLDPD
jgi:hypothetical protein